MVVWLAAIACACAQVQAVALAPTVLSHGRRRSAAGENVGALLAQARALEEGVEEGLGLEEEFFMGATYRQVKNHYNIARRNRKEPGVLAGISEYGMAAIISEAWNCLKPGPNSFTISGFIKGFMSQLGSIVSSKSTAANEIESQINALGAKAENLDNGEVGEEALAKKTYQMPKDLETGAVKVLKVLKGVKGEEEEDLFPLQTYLAESPEAAGIAEFMQAAQKQVDAQKEKIRINIASIENIPDIYRSNEQERAEYQKVVNQPGTTQEQKQQANAKLQHVHTYVQTFEKKVLYSEAMLDEYLTGKHSSDSWIEGATSDAGFYWANVERNAKKFTWPGPKRDAVETYQNYLLEVHERQKGHEPTDLLAFEVEKRRCDMAIAIRGTDSCSQMLAEA